MPNNWNDEIIKEFRANGGTVKAFAKQPLLLLRTTGAKSGAERVNPLAYLKRDDTLYVFASFNARPINPAWYHNLKAHPKVTVEVGTETFEAVATEVLGAERDDVYAEQAAFNPGFAEYEKKTTRVIPVIALTRA
ncbi:MAG TPA: nitroreductase/quinone reductase family protein [Micromonosporaceae bacterium]|nr:nitroreductase/quinone reductase family protein [Micromonosporaceae bacterium]